MVQPETSNMARITCGTVAGAAVVGGGLINSATGNALIGSAEVNALIGSTEVCTPARELA
jgi:hypothetical protein